MIRNFLIISIVLIAVLNAKNFGDWTVKGNDKYRFAEQYGLQDTRSNGERYNQRIDFTFSKNKGWEMTLTTSFLTDKNDIVNLIIDDKKYSFMGQGSVHKQTFKLKHKIIKEIMNAKHNLIIEEIYKTGDKYKAVFSIKGSYSALLWVRDLN